MPDDHPDDLRAKVFRDRVDLANWRAEMLDEDGSRHDHHAWNEGVIDKSVPIVLMAPSPGQSDLALRPLLRDRGFVG
jgi:hypothetical protein